MKNIFNNFMNLSMKLRILIVFAVIIAVSGICTATYMIINNEALPTSQTKVYADELEEDRIESVIEEEIKVAQDVEPIVEDTATEESEEKEITFNDKTVKIPKSTVASANSSEDAEKNKKTGGDSVNQEQANEMFQNEGTHSNGIDVSSHQGNINWAQVAASGVDFAIIRCGFRGQTAGGIYEDAYFKTNVTGATANGIKVGIYFYSTAVNETEALEEAAWVVSKIASYRITYPVVYDFEDFGAYRCASVDGNQATKNALTFLNYIKSAGYEPMMYANKNDITNRMSRSSFSCKFWLAHYTSQTDYKGSFSMWQYTSRGSVPGISGNVDMNVAYFSYGTTASPKHTHSYTEVVKGSEKAATCTEEGTKTLRCSCGETQTETIAKVDHTWGSWVVSSAATTTQEGVEKRVCSVCQKEETKKIDKLKPTNTTSNTNTNTNTNTNSNTNNNSISSNSNTNTNDNTNTVCTHNYQITDTKEATCTENGYEIKKCTICGDEEKTVKNSTGHTPGDWIIDVEPTATTEGSKHKICSKCNATTNTESISPTGNVESSGESQGEENSSDE